MIDNWALRFSMNCDILNIWNAVILEKNEEITENGSHLLYYTIKNDNHNMDIPVGGQIEAGMTMSIPVNSNPILLPNTYTMVQKEVIVSESDYIVNAFIFGDTNYNYNGFITIRNISERTIEDWSLACLRLFHR
ncbi:MAG: hypothetical protein IJL55_08725 [Lachnospiraceae bacterium]|nr:hypothetical protein [Lachnospiraceae bacterium]